MIPVCVFYDIFLPSYQLQPQRPSQQLRSTSRNLFHIPRMRTCFAQGSFANSVPYIWNTLSVGHNNHEPYKKGWTSCNTIRNVDSGGSVNRKLDGESRSPNAKGQLWGHWAAHCKVQRLCHKLRKNSWTDTNAVRDMDMGEPKEPCIRSPQMKAILKAKRGRPRTCPDISGGWYAESDSAGGSTGMAQMPVLDGGGCTLVPPGIYAWTICVLQRCGLMSN